MSVLAQRLLAVHAALGGAGLAHAFGGAIALAYCTLEPRGTRDVDVNVFVPAQRADEALDALPDAVRITETDRQAARSDGQVRVRWDDTPIDAFFDTHDFHRAAAGRVRQVPFAGTTIPVLACEDLTVFKAMYNRTRDWADIEAMLDARAIDGHEVLDVLRSLLGPADPAVVRLGGLVTHP